jgi:hypothetical protein
MMPVQATHIAHASARQEPVAQTWGRRERTSRRKRKQMPVKNPKEMLRGRERRRGRGSKAKVTHSCSTRPAKKIWRTVRTKS